MLLEKYFSEIKDYLTIRKLHKKYKKNIAQRILVRWLLNKEKLYEDEGKTIYRNIIAVKVNRYAKSEIDLDENAILNKLEKEKKFLVDLSLFKLHSNKGRRSLMLQLQHSLAVIRDFLFDKNLILVGNLDLSFLGNNRVLRYKNINDLPLEKYKAIILDPNGELVLNGDLIKNYNLFIIGGIVDVGLEWHGATEYLFRDLNLPRARIELDGSLIGVPDRINLLIKILLETYYLGTPLEKSIVNNQGKKDIIRRLWYEIKRYSKNKEIKKEDIDKILKNIKVSREKMTEFLYKNDIRII